MNQSEFKKSVQALFKDQERRLAQRMQAFRRYFWVWS